MPVSRGYALALSAALHTAGLGVAGWATYGQYREPAGPVEVQATLAYPLAFLTLAPLEPRPVPEPRALRAPARVRREARAPVAPSPSASVPGTTGGPRPSAALQQATAATGPATSPLRTQELAPGVTVAAIPMTPPPAETGPESGPPVPRGVYQAAALVTPAGSACPELPAAAPEWDGREVSVAVAFVVDTSGKVDPSRIHIVESPGRQPAGRGFYPRIYVVGTKAGPGRAGVDPARYDSLVTHAVTSHIAALQFRPALVGGRPVRSTVLVACHQSPGD
jgi:hypothetical protein